MVTATNMTTMGYLVFCLVFCSIYLDSSCALDHIRFRRDIAGEKNAKDTLGNTLGNWRNGVLKFFSDGIRVDAETSDVTRTIHKFSRNIGEAGNAFVDAVHGRKPQTNYKKLLIENNSNTANGINSNQGSRPNPALRTTTTTTTTATTTTSPSTTTGGKRQISKIKDSNQSSSNVRRYYLKNKKNNVNQQKLQLDKQRQSPLSQMKMMKAAANKTKYSKVKLNTSNPLFEVSNDNFKYNKS